MVTRKKAISDSKKVPNYIVIKFGYNNEFVFPYAEGIELLKQFEHAEWYDTSDYSKPIISNIKKGDNLTVEILSGAEYLALKTKALLGMNNESE